MNDDFDHIFSYLCKFWEMHSRKRKLKLLRKPCPRKDWNFFHVWCHSGIFSPGYIFLGDDCCQTPAQPQTNLRKWVYTNQHQQKKLITTMTMATLMTTTTAITIISRPLLIKFWPNFTGRFLETTTTTTTTSSSSTTETTISQQILTQFQLEHQQQQDSGLKRIPHI